MLSPSPSPSPLPSPSILTFPVLSHPYKSSSLAFSPPLIAMVVVVAAAFVAATYSRLISRNVLLLRRRYHRYRRHRRRRLHLLRSPSDLESGPYTLPSSDGFQTPSPFGLHDSVIKSIPLSIISLKTAGDGAVQPVLDCAVCLLEFEDKEYVRTLPACRHAFHVDCIDIWLRSHANCPLCRAEITFRLEPVMAAMIRPSHEDMIFETTVLEPLEETPECPHDHACSGEITQEQEHEDMFERRDFLLKRSYSFSLERNLGSERLSPYRKNGGFWSKRASPFGLMEKPRVFSFRYYRGMKSPFFRRRGGFFPFSERGGVSSRRSKSMASPMFMRSAGATVGAFSSSRMRSGDPEALLSPERFNRR